MGQARALHFPGGDRTIWLVASRIAGHRTETGEWQTLSPACIRVTWMVASSMHSQRENWMSGSHLAVGWRETSRTIPACGRSVPMNRHENQVFENQHVILDDGVY